MEIAIPAGKTVGLELKDEHFGVPLKFSVAAVKDKGWVIKIKDAPNADGAIARVHPGQTVRLVTGGQLFAESTYITTLTITPE